MTIDLFFKSPHRLRWSIGLFCIVSLLAACCIFLSPPFPSSLAITENEGAVSAPSFSANSHSVENAQSTIRQFNQPTLASESFLQTRETAQSHVLAESITASKMTAHSKSQYGRPNYSESLETVAKRKTKPHNFQITQQSDGSQILTLPEDAALPVVLNPEAKIASVQLLKSDGSRALIKNPKTLETTAANYASERVDQIAAQFVEQISHITSQGQTPTLVEWEDATYLANESFRSLVGTEEYKVRLLAAALANLREMELAGK